MVAIATPERIEAQTDNGGGLVLPVAKALTHIMTVYTAISREWPLIVADASAELQEAANHMAAASIPEQLMTEEAVSNLNAWKGSLMGRITSLNQQVDLDADLTTIDTEPLKNLARDTWQLLSILDAELTGLPANVADPGLMP